MSDTEIVYTLDDIKNIIKSNELSLKKKYKIIKFLIFGSYARGEQTAESDIDLLVEFQEPIGMFKFMDLEEDLEKIFNKKVDLGTPDYLKPYVKNSILKEAIVL